MADVLTKRQTMGMSNTTALEIAKGRRVANAQNNNAKKSGITKPTAPKAKKEHPLQDARKAMLQGVKEERQSLSDCKRLLATFSGAWLKVLKMDAKAFKDLTPEQLRPYQKENERYRAVIDDSGLSKIETGWTPAKVAKAVERMQAATAAK